MEASPVILIDKVAMEVWEATVRTSQEGRFLKEFSLKTLLLSILVSTAKRRNLEREVGLLETWQGATHKPVKTHLYKTSAQTSWVVQLSGSKAAILMREVGRKHNKYRITTHPLAKKLIRVLTWKASSKEVDISLQVGILMYRLL